ncbi:hypothetical protein CWR48_13995 [Oceanobacillus arenosus]|uniref:Uncharacterized protein n=1 Tax=Oceanobacillus arenosus TaxID=1229153 RepID=A0A3D8PNE6_9BACI|nr:hypothetical protein [Oceanobacillus arenosus]RDW17623.1 hypothetical protein CWR48_13995 [Oceanobacillus arenosus]
MADNKSCEGKLTTLECMKCGYREVFTEQQFRFTDGLSCDVCNGPTQPALTRPEDKIRNRRMKSQSTKTNLSMNMDFSESIKGLKAIQREAKKATAALKELEEQKKEKYLVIELDELGDVPKVLYKGKEINKKEFVNFQWTTKSDVPGNTDIIIDYYGDNNWLLERKSIREGISS